MWYQDGTVSLTNGSASVVGLDTYFSLTVKPGDIFTADRQSLYMIVSVTDDTNVTIWPAWNGVTGDGVSYSIIRNFTSSTTADLAEAMTKIVASWQVREDEFKNWLGGTTTGGPNSDGYYPLTDAEGNTIMLASPAKLTDWLHDGIQHTAEEIVAMLTDDVAVAQQAASDAEAARDITLAAKVETLDARDVTVAAKLSAVAASTTVTAQVDIAVRAKEDTLAATASLISQATTQATLASDKAAAASQSETNAAASATTSGNKATAAALSEGNAAGSAQTAQDWAVKMDAKVQGLDWSAKYYWNQTVILNTATATLKGQAEAAATTATDKATAAAASEATATAKAQIATDNAALTAADAVTTTQKASEAAASASAAHASEVNAGDSEAAAAASATLASDKSAAASSDASAAQTARFGSEAARDVTLSVQSDVTTKASAVSANMEATQTYASEANASKITSMQASTDAVAAKVDAVNAKDLSVAAKEASVTAQNLAQAFANSARGYQVTPGTYSAYHWAMEAKDYSQLAATIVGGSNFGIIGDGTTQRFTASGPGSLLNLIQGTGIKLTFNPANWGIGFSFDSATATITAIGGMSSLTVQAALEELNTKLSTLSPDKITKAGGSVTVNSNGGVDIIPAVGQTANYNGYEVHNRSTAYSKAETDTAIAGAQTAGAAKLTTARSISLSGGVVGTATFFDGTADISIPVTSIAASALTGFIDIARLPAGALDRLLIVTDDAARFALTTNDVQKGDTVQVGTGGPMYRVVDESNLGNTAGYVSYTAGRASAVDWSGVENKPSTVGGYGITDAYTKGQTDSAISTAISALSPNSLTQGDSNLTLTDDGNAVLTGRFDGKDLFKVGSHYVINPLKGTLGDSLATRSSATLVGTGNAVRFFGTHGLDNVSNPGAGGLLQFTGGSASTGSNKAGGGIVIGGGTSDGTAAGGGVSFSGGSGGASGNGGTAGVYGGSGVIGGSASLLGGTATAGPGGTVYISTPDSAGTNQNGAPIVVSTGLGTGTGLGGDWSATIAGSVTWTVSGSFTINGSSVLRAADAATGATADSVAKRRADGGLEAYALTLIGASPNFVMNESDAPSDSKNWVTLVNGNVQTDYLMNDAGSASTPIRTVTRNGMTLVGVDYKIAPTVNGAPMGGNSVTKSAVTVLPATGTISVTAKTILAVYLQFIGQTFTVDYNTEANYTQENAATGTDQVAGQFQLYNTAGAQIDSATKLLIHANGDNGSTEIIDERGITPFGTHCGWLDGASSWVVPASYKTAFGAAQNFTLEGWMRPDGNKTVNSPFTIDATYSVRWSNNGTFGLYQNGASWGDVGPSSFPANAWYHVALVRNNGTVTLYVNGTSIYSVASSVNMASKALIIGHDGGTYQFSGWLDQIRLSKVARYSANFTPPTAAFVTDADTVHLFTFDDGHGGQVLKDRSNSGHEINLGGDAVVSVSRSKFGTGSLRMSGNGSMQVAQSKPHADFNMGADDFTISFWVWADSLSNNPNLFLSQYGGWYGVRVRGVSSGQAVLYLSSNGTSDDLANALTFGALPTGQWNHIAVCRSGASLYASVNGVVGATVSVGTSTLFWGTNKFFIFGNVQDGSAPLTGNFDEVLVKRGVAEWTANFTPPTAPHVADDHTILLLHFEGANGDKVTLDSSGSSYGINAFGDTTTPSLAFQGNPALANTYTRGGHSTALLLEGGNKYVLQTFATPSAGHLLYFDSNTKLCIEGWFYISAVTAGNFYQLVNLTGASLGTGTEMSFYVSNAGALTFAMNGTVVVNGPSISTGWHHCALVRDGRGWAVALDGALTAPVSPNLNPAYTNEAYTLYVGSYHGTASFLGGAIDSFRITNGHPRYTANFTPATLVADDMTTLMWEFNGAVGQKWVKELSGNSALIAANGNARTVKDGRYLPPSIGAKISTAWAVFGSGSLAFDGTNPGINLGTGSEWQFPGDFSVDARIRLNTTGIYHTIAAKGGAAAASDRAWDFSVNSSNKLSFNVYVGTTIYNAVGATSLVSGTSYHVAAVRSGNTLMVFLNGVLDGSVTMSGTMNTSTVAARVGSFWTGASELSISNAYFDEVRISSIARWTAAFTPPTIAYGQQFVTGPYYVATTNSSDIDVSDWSTIHSATISQSTPPGTSIKWVVSFDGRATWKYWTGTAWAAIASLSGANIDANGNDYLTLQNALANLNVEAYSTIDFAFSLKTSNQSFSPSVDAITLARDEYELGAVKIDYTIKRNGAAGAEVHKITNLKPYPCNIVYDYVA